VRAAAFPASSARVRGGRRPARAVDEAERPRVERDAPRLPIEDRGVAERGGEVVPVELGRRGEQVVDRPQEAAAGEVGRPRVVEDDDPVRRARIVDRPQDEVEHEVVVHDLGAHRDAGVLALELACELGDQVAVGDLLHHDSEGCARVSGHDLRSFAGALHVRTT
jgi:hypothetical protein